MMDDFDDTAYHDYMRERNLSLLKLSSEDAVVCTNPATSHPVEESLKAEPLPDYIIAAGNVIQEESEVIELSSDDEPSEDEVEFVYELTPSHRRRKGQGTQAVATYKEISKEEYIEAFRIKAELNTGRIERCHTCNSYLIGTDKEYQLAKKNKPGLCDGCHRYNMVIPNKKEKLDFISWLITGHPPQYDKPIRPNFTSMCQRLQNRRKEMVKRLRHKGGDGKNLATTSEMYYLCLESGFKCSITGSEVGFPNKRGKPYWALTVDHRVPLYLSCYDPEAWSKDNLQVMSHVMNSVKGHYCDNEVYRWYKAIMKANLVEL